MCYSIIVERKPKKLHFVSLVISKADKRAVIAEARRRGIGISSLVRMLIKDFLTKREGDNSKTFDISN